MRYSAHLVPSEAFMHNNPAHHSNPVIQALHYRVSVGDLVDPAPDAAQRELLFRAALRAPDHGQLRPWRFLLVEGEERARVGQIIADVEDAC